MVVFNLEVNRLISKIHGIDDGFGCRFTHARINALHEKLVRKTFSKDLREEYDLGRGYDYFFQFASRHFKSLAFQQVHLSVEMLENEVSPECAVLMLENVNAVFVLSNDLGKVRSFIEVVLVCP